MANLILNGHGFKTPSWMQAREVQAFMNFRSRHLPNLELLTPPEADSLLLFRWARLTRNHSANQPQAPEHPFFAPRFPATGTLVYGNSIPGLEEFSVLLKDESSNPTGTHKARMAWEILVSYMLILERKAKGAIGEASSSSILTFGSTAFALAYMFNSFFAPAPKILCPDTTPEEQVMAMQRKGLEVYTANLRNGKLTADDVVRLTQNGNGRDLTLGLYGYENSRNFYDWLSFEVLNLEPDIIIVPYGSGDLFNNLLLHMRDEILEINGKDPRFDGNRERLCKTSIIGVSAPPGSEASKVANLYPPLTLQDYKTQNKNLVTQSILEGVIGPLSRLVTIEEADLEGAKLLASTLNLNAETSALVGLAWLLNNKGLIPKESRIVIVNTGRVTE